MMLQQQLSRVRWSKASSGLRGFGWAIIIRCEFPFRLCLPDSRLVRGGSSAYIDYIAVGADLRLRKRSADFNIWDRLTVLDQIACKLV